MLQSRQYHMLACLFDLPSEEDFIEYGIDLNLALVT